MVKKILSILSVGQHFWVKVGQFKSESKVVPSLSPIPDHQLIDQRNQLLFGHLDIRMPKYSVKLNRKFFSLRRIFVR